MTTFSALVEVTLRGVLDRRRTILLLLFVALPVVVGLAIRLSGGRPDVPEILDALVVRTVLPLVALVIGTSALGSEIDDGTFVYLLIKPIARWRLALAKVAVATGLTIALVVPPILATGLLLGGGESSSIPVTLGFALATMAGAAAYASVFTMLGALTSRALILGLAYTLLWEGVLAGLLEGTRFLSIRQATLGLAEALTGEDAGVDALGPAVAVGIVIVAIAGSAALATAALRRFQIRSAD